MASPWTYADWVTLEDQARLDRLRLHIQEVSGFTMGTSTRGQSVTTIDPQYLANLMKEEKALYGRLQGGRAGGRFARNHIKFVRD